MELKRLFMNWRKKNSEREIRSGLKMKSRDLKERRNPMESSNFMSSIFFGWSIPIFWKGARRELGIRDLYEPLKPDESQGLGDRLEREWEKELRKESMVEKNGKKKPKQEPKLLLALFRMFWAPYLVLGLLRLFEAVFLRAMQPILQGLLISCFNPLEPKMSRHDALLYAGLLLIFNLAESLIRSHVDLRCKRIGMCVRVACCSMIYRKILRLDRAKASSAAAGQVANLISNDVARFDELFRVLHYVWIMPIELSLVGYVMWRSVGVAAFVGIGSILIHGTLIQGYLSVLIANLRSKIAVKTDERVQLISELLSAMQVVKMYCWEKPFAIMVNKTRALEMKVIGWVSFQRALNFSVTIFSDKVTLYLTLITFVFMGNSLTAKTTFVLASFIFLLNITCGYFFPIAIIMSGEAAVSLKRVTTFLLLDEAKYVKSVESRSLQTRLQHSRVKHRVTVVMVDVAANWVHGQLPPTLYKMSMRVESGSLCAVVGAVGSGKTSLLHILLGELPVGAGRLSLFPDGLSGTQIPGQNIRISYASQDPWLFFATVRDNILFDQPYNEKRYREVTRVCALDTDFKQLPQGDLSYVGERGASLSGGQKARVNLARAIYREADLYLLDDPLSAVDSRVGRHLFDECITRFLKDKTRILVTHQLQYLRQTDSVVVLSGGTVEYQGSYEKLVELKFHDFDPQSHEKVENVERDYEVTSESKVVGCRNQIFKTVNEPPSSEDETRPEVADSGGQSTEVIAEGKAAGDVSSKVYRDYFLAGGNVCTMAILVIVTVASGVLITGSDYWVTYWTNQETLRTASESEISVDHNGTQYNNFGNDHGEVNSSWFDARGLLFRESGIYAYTVLVVGCVLLNTLQCTMFVKTCANSSSKIHDSMTANLLKAPMRFFNTNPSGRILNIFSKDVGTMDELIPGAMQNMIQALKMMITTCGMILIVNYWMAIPAIVFGAICYIIGTFYIRTAEEVKRLEAIAKSPLFSHVRTTLDGLTTIQSRGDEAETLLRREFDRHQDKPTGAWYLFISTSSAFGFSLDVITTAFIGCICFSLILLDDGDTLPGFAGLAISHAFMLNGCIEYGLVAYTTVVSYMTSVERVLQYTNLPTEEPFTSKKPPPSTWPSQGGLTMKNVTMTYAQNNSLALKNVNVRISPGWKVGVVGRTGAGKSSLISALFRLAVEGLEGEIVLDGIETGSIGLHELRPRISIIPQEPILFSATLRYNLDPFHEYDDHRLWDAIREVELGHVLTSLDAPVAAAGANFSVGQRQLICLARAILRNNRILVLDEATANIDQRTDALIQKTIKRRFAECTVLTIAHRLNTIMNSDRVLVMAGGEIVEFGHPDSLLKNPDGYFSQMVEQSGNRMAEKLSIMAETTHLNSEKL